MTSLIIINSEQLSVIQFHLPESVIFFTQRGWLPWRWPKDLHYLVLNKYWPTWKLRKNKCQNNQWWQIIQYVVCDVLISLLCNWKSRIWHAVSDWSFQRPWMQLYWHWVFMQFESLSQHRGPCLNWRLGGYW